MIASPPESSRARLLKLRRVHLEFVSRNRQRELDLFAVEKPESAVKTGQALQFKILKLDPAQKKIGLSARAVGKENDPEDVRNYHETGAGMATLGDIANLLSAASDKKRD